MSGYEADTFTDELNAPVGPFVSKPFSEQRLLGAMREALAAVPAGSGVADGRAAMISGAALPRPRHST
jgi:hypothetical protein